MKFPSALSVILFILATLAVSAGPAEAHDAVMKCEVVKGVAECTAEFPRVGPMKGPIYVLLDANGKEVTTGVGDAQGRFSVKLPQNYDGCSVIARDLLGHRSVFNFPKKPPQ